MKLEFKHPKETDAEMLGRKYWKSLDEAADSPEFHEWLHREFPQGASEIEGVDRRQFLKIMAASFSLAGLGLAGCRQPEQHVLPYAKQPEGVVPGIPSYFSTSMPRACENIPLIVETHSNRPTKIEGNPSYKAFNGSTDSFAQASILNLYDVDRVQSSHDAQGNRISKQEVITLLNETYSKFKANGGAGLAFLAEMSTSPSRNRLVKILKDTFPKAVWAEYEPISHKNPQQALSQYLGISAKPVYNFKNAKRILSLDADFLHNEPNALQYAKDFSSTRKVASAKEVDKMNRLYMAETDYSLTGAMADHRIRVASSHMLAFAALVAEEVFELSGGSKNLLRLFRQKTKGLQVNQKWVNEVALDLVANKGQALVVAGSQLPKEVHLIVALINKQLNAEDSTVSYLETPENTSNTIEQLADSINQGIINTLFVLGGNPVYNAPANLNWEKLQKSVPNVYRYGYHFDETSIDAKLHIAANHYLESWSDGQTYLGTYVPVQPMILPLFDGFSELELLQHLTGNATPDAYQFVQETFNQLIPNGNIEEWLALGVANGAEFKTVSVTYNPEEIFNAIAQIEFNLKEHSIDNLEVRFKSANNIFDGRYANNGWLQELPDPMTKLAWDNAISISPRLAKELQEKTGLPILSSTTVMNRVGMARVNENNFKRGREQALIAELTVNGKTIRGPLHIQPGLANYSVILPLGYGRTHAGRVGNNVGFNFYPARTTQDSLFATEAKLNVTSEVYELANTQEHWSLEGRAIVREASAEDYSKHPDFASKMGVESHAPANLGANKNDPLYQTSRDIPRGGGAYKTPNFPGEQQWGMTIDLNTCTGCNACVLACQSENNIPIVGKDQMLRGREMHWIRLDRYFSSGSNHTTELPEDPQVSFMSMLCQHCELAPCETVCPVNATVHDEEGLNVMAYNRCVGTRYCANNCPYKVRRFNFFDWNKREINHFYEGPLGPAGVPELQKMQKNPEVTVRMRGVMEKCTFCVQRIEEAKINQRTKVKDSPNVKVPDGTLQTACQQVCPTDSIVFGDIADPTTKVYQEKMSERNYSVLGYLNTRPRTTYLAKLRNPNPRMPDAYDQPLSRKEYEDRYGHASHSEGHAVSHH